MTSNRDQTDNKRHRERHHVNPKRERSNNKKDKEESVIDDGKYKPPSGIDWYLVESIENSVIQRVIYIIYIILSVLDINGYIVLCDI